MVNFVGLVIAILCLVLYHKVFTVIYTRPVMQIIREVFIALVIGAIITGFIFGKI